MEKSQRTDGEVFAFYDKPTPTKGTSYLKILQFFLSLFVLSNCFSTVLFDRGSEHMLPSVVNETIPLKAFSCSVVCVRRSGLQMKRSAMSENEHRAKGNQMLELNIRTDVMRFYR